MSFPALAFHRCISQLPLVSSLTPNTLVLPPGIIAAFGDYDADQLLDIFYLSSDQRSLTAYTWDRTAYEWREKVEARIRTKSDFIIVNVVPGDYNYDGRLDVLLMGGKNPGGWWGQDETLEMEVYLQQADGSFCTSCFRSIGAEGIGADLVVCVAAGSNAVASSGLAQPMVFDATGDMHTDLLGVSAESSKAPKLWKNVWDSSNRTSLFNVYLRHPPARDSG